MKRIRDLEVNDFPGINPGKFKEWKNLQEENAKKAKIAIPIAIILWLILVFLCLLPRIPFLPTVIVIISFILIMAYGLRTPIKIFKLQKELGITIKDVREARKK